MSDEIQNNRHAVVEESVLQGDYSIDKEISGSRPSDEQSADTSSV